MSTHNKKQLDTDLDYLVAQREFAHKILWWLDHCRRTGEEPTTCYGLWSYIKAYVQTGESTSMFEHDHCFEPLLLRTEAQVLQCFLDKYYSKITDIYRED